MRRPTIIFAVGIIACAVMWLVMPKRSASVAWHHSTSGQAQTVEEVLPEAAGLVQKIGNRSVNIKVGVLSPEARKAHHFWVEFDPTVAPSVTDTRLMLPYIAAPVPKESAVFYIHSVGGCSSALTPSSVSEDEDSYKREGLAMCEQVLASAPPSRWKLWDTPYPTEAAFRGTVASAANACFSCQSISQVIGVRRFKAIALSTVLSWFDHINIVDIDAQGLDVALVLSLSGQLSKVQSIKIECQEQGRYLYRHEFAGQQLAPNNCTLAKDLLIRHGFNCSNEINNCACGELNLFCSRAS